MGAKCNATDPKDASPDQTTVTGVHYRRHAESIAKIQLAVKAPQAVIVQYVRRPWSLICSLKIIIKFLLSGSLEEEGFTKHRTALAVDSWNGHHITLNYWPLAGQLASGWANQDSQPWSMSQ